MVRFEGEKAFAQSPAFLFEKLTDLSFLLTCLPDVSKVEGVTASEARFVLRPGFAFLRANLNAHLTLVEKVPDREALFRVVATGIGSSSTVEASMNLAPQETGTLLCYSVAVTQLGGLLKMVPSGLVRGAAQQVVTDVLARVARKLA